MAKVRNGIIDFADFKKAVPGKAEGRVCLEFTDPVTGKVKDRIEGQNHVFSEALFSGNNLDWISSVSNAWMCLNTPNDTIDTTIPYLFGQTVGYGRPGLGTLGTYRGAYNAANQVIAEITLDHIRWKFQYDFTTAQANGTSIGTVGLTHQYATDVQKRMIKNFTTTSVGGANYTTDGRYSYVCSTVGVITKYDVWLGTSSTIDVSATVGTTAASIKTVGYAPATGKYYIFVYSATTTLRKMYVFSSSSFATLENTYSPSNVAFGSSVYPLYIYGTIAYMFSNSANTIYYADFSANNAYSTITVSTNNNAAYAENTNTLNGMFYNGSCPISTKYIISFSLALSNNKKGIIFDISTGSVVGYVSSFDSSGGIACVHPLTAEKVVCSTTSGVLYHNSAIAAYKLPTPKTKTSANGMTATYELIVNWAA